MFSKALFTWVAFPVYVWQGIAVRRRTERLAPPRLPSEGRFAGDGDELRLLCVGDSSVAGVGMSDLPDTITFNLARELNARTGRPVYWRAAGANSATAGDLRDHVVPHLDRRDFTHVVLVVGTNDMKNFHAVRKFKKQFGTLVYSVRARFPHAEIMWAPIADMTRIPALPAALGRILQNRAELLNAMGARLCRERGLIMAEPVPIESAEGFARDGFHAGPEGYRSWARHLAGFFLETLQGRPEDPQMPSQLKAAHDDEDDHAGERELPEVAALP